MPTSISPVTSGAAFACELANCSAYCPAGQTRAIGVAVKATSIPTFIPTATAGAARGL